MRSISSHCPNCQFLLRVPDKSWLGKTARCPNCQAKFVLSSSGEQGPAAANDTQTFAVGAEVKTDKPGQPPAPGEENTRSAKPVWQQLIDGRYELLERLGGGGFGVVWKARDVKLDRIVALKLPRRELMDADTARQIQREAQAAARLKHPNIVAVYEVENDGESVYIVSEYVDGITLTEWMEDQTIPFRQAAEMVRTLAATMHYAHEMGVVHRDLKPGNVLIDSAEELHITDFGLAKRDDVESSMSEAGRAMGTPAYMSPEQARGDSRQADRRTDLYSLGVMLFELLTGERPFRGNKLGALQYQILNKEAPKPRTLNPEVPLDLDTVCLKCLEKEPDKRYGTTQKLAEELTRFLNGEPILARPIGRVARLWRACKRQPVVASLTALLVLALLAGSMISAYYGIQADLRAEEATAASEQAITERNKALENEQRAVEAENRLRSEAERLRIQQARQSIAEGDRIRTANNIWPEYLLWYARALELSPEATPEQRINRMRLASALSDYPLEDFWRGVRFAAFSPDGSRIATTSDKGELAVYDVETKKKLATLRASNLPIVHAAFNSDAALLATVGYHKKATVWNIDTKVRIFESPALDDPPVSVQFSPESDLIFVSTFGGRIERFAVSGGQSPPSFPPQYRILDISPDTNRVLAKVNDNTALILDSLSGTRIGLDLKHELPLKGGAFSPDGRLVATYSGNRSEREKPLEFQGNKVSQVRVWEAASGRAQTDPLACPFDVETVAISPDGRLLAAGGKYPGRPSEVRRDAPSRTFPIGFRPEEPSEEAPPAEFSDLVPVAVIGPPDSPLSLWNLAGPSPTRADAHGLYYGTTQITALAFSPNSRILVSAGRGRNSEVVYWKLDEKYPFQDYLNWPVEFVPQSISFDPTGKRVLVSGSSENQGGARLWNMNRSTERGVLDNSQRATIAQFSGDGQTINGAALADGNSGRILTWDTHRLSIMDQKPSSPPRELVRTVIVPELRVRIEKYTVLEAAGPVEYSREAQYTVEVPVQKTQLSIPEFRDGEEAWYRESLGMSPDQNLLILFETDHKDLGLNETFLRLVDARTGRPRSRVMPTASGEHVSRMDKTQRLLLVATQSLITEPPPPINQESDPMNIILDQMKYGPPPAATLEVWDVNTATLVSSTYLPNIKLGHFLQFDEQGRRFLVSFDSGMCLFDLLPESTPSDEQLLLLAKWAAYHDIDEAGSIGEINAEAVSEAWAKLVR